MSKYDTAKASGTWSVTGGAPVRDGVFDYFSRVALISRCDFYSQTLDLPSRLSTRRISFSVAAMGVSEVFILLLYYRGANITSRLREGWWRAGKSGVRLLENAHIEQERYAERDLGRLLSQDDSLLKFAHPSAKLMFACESEGRILRRSVCRVCPSRLVYLRVCLPYCLRRYGSREGYLHISPLSAGIALSADT